MSIEVIFTVVKGEVRMFWSTWSRSDSLFAEEEGKIGTYVAACSELVYTTKYSLIQVSNVSVCKTIVGDVTALLLATNQLAISSAILCWRCKAFATLRNILRLISRQESGQERWLSSQNNYRQRTTGDALKSAEALLSRSHRKEDPIVSDPFSWHSAVKR